MKSVDVVEGMCQAHVWKGSAYTCLYAPEVLQIQGGHAYSAQSFLGIFLRFCLSEGLPQGEAESIYSEVRRALPESVVIVNRLFG